MDTIEKESIKIDPILKKVSKILDLDEAQLLISQEKNWFKNTFDNILVQYWTNPEITSLALKVAADDIRKSSANFYDIDEKLRKNEELWKVFIESSVREWKTFMEIDDILKVYFSDNKYKWLIKYYKKYIKTVSNFYNDDLTKSLLWTEKWDTELYKFLVANKIITWKWKAIILDDNFLQKSLVALNENITTENLKEKEKLEKQLLWNIIWFDLKSLDTNWLFVLDTIYKLVKLVQDKQKIKEKEVEEWEYIVEDKDTSKSTWIDINTEDKSDYLDSKLDFCTPNCSYSYYSWYYEIETVWAENVKLSETEIDNMTSVAIRNYIKFYNTIYDLWLIFLWNKYKSDFITLSNNKFWFDYSSWEWITDWKMLSVLNMIWRNIWTPEHKIIWEDWKETSELRCFKTLWDAKESFRNIKDTGKINWEKYSDNDSFSYWAVENKLIEVLCIDQKGNWLNINSWK